jgi:hypothetical protein
LAVAAGAAEGSSAHGLFLVSFEFEKRDYLWGSNEIGKRTMLREKIILNSSVQATKTEKPLRKR